MNVRWIMVGVSALLLGFAVFFSVVVPPEPSAIPGLDRPARKWLAAQKPYRHLPGYFVLAVVCQWAFSRRALRRVMIVAAGLVVLAGALEILQVWMPHRKADWFDFVMSCGGVILGSLPAAFRARRAGRPE